MKKLLGLLSLFMYLVSTNAILHAQSMGILSMPHTMATGCHGHESTSSGPASSQHIDCCELVYSLDYRHCQLKITDFQKVFSFVLPTFLFAYREDDIAHRVVCLSMNFPPGWNPDIKYHQFSDLMGIVVDLA